MVEEWCRYRCNRCARYSYRSGRCPCGRMRDASCWVELAELVSDARSGVEGAEDLAVEAIEREGKWIRG